MLQGFLYPPHVHQPRKHPDVALKPRAVAGFSVGEVGARKLTLRFRISDSEFSVYLEVQGKYNPTVAVLLAQLQAP